MIIYDGIAIDAVGMETVTISSKYQVVMPKQIRRKLGLCPGQKVQTVVHENRNELVPVQPARNLRSFLKGLDTRVERGTPWC
jgi:AbrB family looped-hinge helix DNA binding protein